MKDLLFCRDNNQQQQHRQYDSMQDQTYISVPNSPNFKVPKKFPRTQFSKYRFKNESASVSKRRASKLRLKTARKSRLILNKSWIQIIRLLTFSLALHFRKNPGNIRPGNICPGNICPGSILRGNISPCSPLVLTGNEAFS